VSWKSEKLTDICTVTTGKWDANHASVDGEFRFYTCASKFLLCDTKRYEGKNIILPGNGANVGDVYFYDGAFDAYQRTYVLSDIKLIPEYLFYHLQSNWEETNRFKQYGSATNFLKIGNFKDYVVSYPSITTQQKIVAKLDAIFSEIDTATAAAEANSNNAEVLFQSYLETFFLNISTSSKFIKLSDVIKLEYGKGLEDSDRKVDGIYGAYGANGVKAKTNKFLYDKPSIVVGRKGSAGELTLVEDKFWALDVTYYVTHDNKETDLYFLYYALKMLNIPTLAKGIKPGINRNDVYDLRIPLPTLSEQKLVVEKILFVSKNLEVAKNSYKAKCKELIFLKQSILKKAFSGELVEDWV
jgi:type I restriction enzyme S subunit